MALDGLMVVFADAGQGDCTLIFFPNEEVWMVDCGCKINKEVQEVVAARIPELIGEAFEQKFGKEGAEDKKSNGKWKIDLLILTHPDIDHYNQVVKISEKVQFSRVIYGGKEEDYGKSDMEELEKGIDYYKKELIRLRSPRYKLRGRDKRVKNLESQIDELKKKKKEYEKEGKDKYEGFRKWLKDQLEKQGGKLEREDWPCVCDVNTSTTFLAENSAKRFFYIKNSGTENNSNSIVFRVSYFQYVFYFMADATELVERLVLKKWDIKIMNENKTVILKVSHHGSHNSSIPGFLEELAPDICVISSDVRSFGGYSLPRKSLIERLIKNIKTPHLKLILHSYYYWDETKSEVIKNKGKWRIVKKEDELCIENTQKPICTTLYNVKKQDNTGKYEGGAWWFHVNSKKELRYRPNNVKDKQVIVIDNKKWYEIEGNDMDVEKNAYDYMEHVFESKEDEKPNKKVKR